MRLTEQRILNVELDWGSPMRPITRALQTLLVLAITGAVIFGIVSQSKVASVGSEVANPASDPKYASVAGLSFADQYLYPDQALVREFRAADEAFDRAEASAEYERRSWLENRNGAFGAALLSTLLLAFVSTPWEPWLRRRVDDVGNAAGDMFEAARSRIEAHNEGTQIVRRDGLAHYSVADEMLKWKQLRDDGVVTDAEFEDAKTKLLGRKTEG